MMWAGPTMAFAMLSPDTLTAATWHPGLHAARTPSMSPRDWSPILAEALHYAHTQDLFHRDIKPANILIDASGVPALADFGLALTDENYGKGARTRRDDSVYEPRAGAARAIWSMDVPTFSVWRSSFTSCSLGAGRSGGKHATKSCTKIINHEPRPPARLTIWFLASSSGSA